MVKNQVILITGAARGIGFEIGKVFAENGARVVLTDMDEAEVKILHYSFNNQVMKQSD